MPDFMTSSPFLVVTRFAARSTVKSSVRTVGGCLAGGTLRLAARTRASSSAMLNGLVT